MVRAAAILLTLSLAACSGRSTRDGDAAGGRSGSSGDAGNGGGGSSSGASPSGGTSSGMSSGGAAPTGGSAGTPAGSSGGPSGGVAGDAGAGGSDAEAGAGAGGMGGTGECSGEQSTYCRNGVCPGTQTCQRLSGRCVPSRCDCVDGNWACTRDCGGGICVDTTACTTPNPAGCADDDECPPGQDCLPPVLTVCIPLDCGCSPMDGTWDCRDECGGGVCRAPD